MAAMVEAGALRVTVTTGLKEATRDLFAFSSSLPDSDLRWKVVWRAFWFDDASTLTLCFAMTCFMISPSVTGLLSLPAVDKSIVESVKVSVTTFCLGTEGLMRGAALPQDEATGLVDGAGAAASDGKACSDSVSRGAAPFDGPLRAGFAGALSSLREGKGSGVPSSWCLL